MNDDTKRLREAARDYVVDPPVTTMSSKRQITLPAEVVRHLGLKPGAKLAVYVVDGTIVLRHRPGTWLEYVTSGPPGMTKNEVDAYLRELRGQDEEHAQQIEGDAYIAADED